MTSSQLKASRQKSQISLPQGSGPWNNGLVVPMFSEKLCPLFHLGPYRRPNSSTNAAKLYELVGAARGDDSQLFRTPSSVLPRQSSALSPLTH